RTLSAEARRFCPSSPLLTTHSTRYACADPAGISNDVDTPSGIVGGVASGSCVPTTVHRADFTPKSLTSSRFTVEPAATATAPSGTPSLTLNAELAWGILGMVHRPAQWPG